MIRIPSSGSRTDWDLDNGTKSGTMLKERLVQRNYVLGQTHVLALTDRLYNQMHLLLHQEEKKLKQEKIN
jgi:CRISPR/Cas system-associated protein endoribonuclease Cas2